MPSYSNRAHVPALICSKAPSGLEALEGRLLLSAFVSDDFNSLSLNTSLWTFINPLGDAAVSLDGYNARLAVPGGKAHDLWLAGNQAPRIVQPAVNEDFQIEVKFESVPSGKSATEGILVEADAKTYLRFDFFSSAVGNLNLFAASFANGYPTARLNRAIAVSSGPLYLRVTRQGNAWTQTYSYDGTTWLAGTTFTYALSVTKVGTYAGNAGSPSPAFTGGVDYFFNTAAPIVPEDAIVPVDTTPPEVLNLTPRSGSSWFQVDFNTNEPATAMLDYGRTDAYEMGSIQGPAGAASHSLRVDSLTPETTYHYRIRATDGSGNVTVGQDQVITTTAVAPPVFLSDDFNSLSLNTSLWQFVNPRGDASVSMDGYRARITAPTGAEHDIWTAGNYAPRIMQPAANEDFQIEVKFESVPTGRHALEGILVEADSRTFIRFDFFSSAVGNLNLFAASFANGSPTTRLSKAISVAAAPLYMRITRQGNRWTQTYSYNGVTWLAGASFDYAMAVTKVGAYAGNAGSPSPTFTAAVDYFFNTAAPIVPEDAVVPVDNTPPEVRSLTTRSGATWFQVDFGTSEPATAVLEYGRTDGYESGFIQGPAGAASHTFRVDGLTPETTYHYRIRATDASGNVTIGQDQSLATTPPAPPVFLSDDFNSLSLNTSLWTFINPLGDAAVSLDGYNARLAVPAGKAHDVWTAGNQAPRIVQPAANEDFQIEAKFESVPTGKYALEGVLVEADAKTYLRFDFFSSAAGNLNLFAASFSPGGYPVTRLNKAISVSPGPLYLRVTRQGNLWTQTYSYDGSTWLAGVSFTYALSVTKVGVYAGNAGSPSPAFTAAVDYFFNTAAPIVPEDAVIPVDTTPPEIQNLTARSGSSWFQVDFNTNELATAVLEYGRTTSYELGSIQGPADAASHSLRVDSLTPETTYHYRIRATDGSGNVTLGQDQVITTTAVAPEEPVISVWYGAVQRFGQLGTAQQWVNVLGRVNDPDGVASLTYSLNGGAFQPLGMGPDLRRLERLGDFNVEIDRTRLASGDNTVLIRAADTLGHVSTQLVTVIYTPGATGSMPYTIDWSAVSDISQAAQVVDGRWTIENGMLRTVELGYDRMVVLGDITWTDFEVSVPITIHGYDPAGFRWPSGGPGVGLVTRWQGHADWGNSQPSYGWYPLGAIEWYRWTDNGASSQIQIDGNISNLKYALRSIEMSRPQIWKVRAETLPDGLTQYSMKVWPQGTDEPAGWDLTAVGRSDQLTAGSVALLAHHVDASFGNVTVVPI